MVWTRRVGLAGLLALAGFFLSSKTTTTMVAAGQTIGGYQLLSEVRVTRTVSEFTYRATLTNTSSVPLTGATASAVSLTPTTVMIDGTLTFGPVPAGATVTSTDTFSFRQDRTVLFNWSSVQWTISPVVSANQPPLADAGPDQTILGIGNRVQLTGAGSSDPEGSPLTYQWAFSSTPSGSAAVLAAATTVASTFTPDKKGSYSVRLTVGDGSLTSAPDTVTISVGDTPPTADAGPAQTAPAGTTITLDGSGSSDIDGDPLTFTWTLQSRPAGSAATLAGAGTVHPTFVLDRAGSYVARLTVNDGTATGAPALVTISTTNSAPVANGGPDQTVVVGQHVVLDGSHSSDVDGDPLTFSWSFAAKPAGSTATLQSPTTVAPTFDVDRPGTYDVQLTVNDGHVNSTADHVLITTRNSAPLANAGPDQTALVTQQVTLDGTGSTDVDGDPLTYQWSLTTQPAGSTAVLTNPAAVKPTFTIDRAGIYIAQLIVSDGALTSAADTVRISTLNTAPVAEAGSNQSVVAGQPVTLDGTASSDVDFDPLTYQWSFTSRPTGSAASLLNPNSPTPSFVTDREGTYVVQLIVNDGFASSAPDTVSVTTTNAAPIAHAGPDQSDVAVGSTVTLDGTTSTDPDGQALTYQWSLLSKPGASAATLSSPNSPQPTFVADRSGDYVAQLVVNDGFVNSTPDTVLIRTANRAPAANAGPDQTVTTGALVHLDGSASSDPDGQSLTYQWTLTPPTGSAATLSGATSASPSFTADVAGTYGVSLRVTDTGGVFADDTVTVTATDLPSVTVVATDASASEAGPDPGVFTFTRTGPTTSSLAITFALTGGATNGVDYATTIGSVTIPAGQASATVTITPIDDQIAEPNELVVATILTGTGYAIGSSASDTITIADDDRPTVSVTALSATADELGPSGPGVALIRFTRSGSTTAPLTVQTTISGTATNGTDYDTISSTINFGASQNIVDVSVRPIDDGVIEGDETVVMTLNASADYDISASNSSATVTIIDHTKPVVSVVALTANASEVGPVNGTFRITRNGFTFGALTVHYAMSGSATNGVDYQSVSGTATFPTNQTFVDVSIVPIPDALAEGTETAVITLTASPDYALGAAPDTTSTVTIADAPLPVVTVVATDPDASEQATNTGTFTFSRTGSTTTPLVVHYGVGGTAENGVDYQGIPGTVTIPTGAASATVTISVIQDQLHEVDETVVVAIAADPAYSIGSSFSATVTIADDDLTAVRVTATDAAASEVNADPGVFRLSRDGDVSTALTVSYTVAGSATNGTDYTTVSGSVLFAAGSNTADVTISPINDPNVEGPETVILTVVSGAGYTVAAPSSATVIIADNAPQLVSVTASDATASEIGPDNGNFHFTRTGDLTFPLTVNFTISGTATNGSDYTSIPTSVTFTATQSAADLPISIVKDALVEGSETVIVTLTDGASYDLTTPTSATVTVADNVIPTITVTAPDPDASEVGPDSGTFRFTRAGDMTLALNIQIALSGTATPGLDYSTGTTVTFAAGQATADRTITPLNDGLVEGSETIVASVVDGADYDLNTPLSATITIADNPVPLVSVTATDATASEIGPDTGTFRLTRTGSSAFPLTVAFTFDPGSTAAINGTDFVNVPLTIDIPAGQTSVDLTITPITDAVPEATEFVQLRITDAANYDLGSPSIALVNIADSSPIVTVVATDATAGEDGPDTGTFTFTRSGGTGNISAPLVVNFTVSGTATEGTDYQSIGTTVTIPAGATTATVTVTPLADAATENVESVVVSLAPGAYFFQFSAAAQVQIADSNLPVISVAAIDANAAEPGADPGVFRFTRTGSTAALLNVTYTVGGTATNNGVTDFSPSLNGTLQFPAGQSSVDLSITPTNDALVEGNETIIVTLVDALPYNLGAASATVTIADQPIPVVTVTALDPNASEVGSDTGTFRFTRVGDTTFALNTTYAIGGTATNNGVTDFTPSLNGGVTFPAGQSTVDIVITPANDALVEGPETIILTVQDGAQYNPGAENQATVTIADRPTPIVTVTAIDAIASEVGPDAGTFRFTRVGDTSLVLDTTYAISGTATNNGVTDFTPVLTGSVRFAAGQDTFDIVITPANDALVEGPETIVVTVNDGAQYDVGTASQATITIADQPTPIITVTAIDAAASEVGRDPGTFHFTRVGDTTFALTVNYGVSGTAINNTTDFTPSLNGGVNFPAGQSAVDVVITPANDAVVEGPETVIVTLQDGAQYDVGASAVATVTIADQPTPIITVTAIDAAASEVGRDPGTFRFTRVGDTTFALNVNYSVSGTAINNTTDFTPSLGGNVNFPAGQSSADVVITPVTDALVEGPETVIVTLQDGPQYDLGVSTAATVTIADQSTPIITVTAIDAAASEVGPDPGTFRFTRAGDTTFALNVSYSVSGTAINNTTDFTPSLSGSVNFPAGQSSVDVVITPVADSLIEGPETVIVTLQDGAQYDLGISAQATITIADNLPAVSVIATDWTAVDGASDTGTFTFTRGGSTAAPMTVNFTVSGTATPGVDYTVLPTSVVIPAGQSSATTTVTPINDTLVEGIETVTVTLATGLYNIGAPSTATVDIVDNTSGVVVVATDADASEDGSNTATFTIARLGGVDLTSPLVVNYTIGGTATSAADFTPLGSSVTIPSGQSSVDLTVTPVADGVAEGDETVVLMIDPGAYNLGPLPTATVTIFEGPRVPVTLDFEDQPDSIPTTSFFPATYRGFTFTNWRQYAPVPPFYQPNGINAIFGAVDGASISFTERVFSGAWFSRFLSGPVFYELYRNNALVWTSALLPEIGTTPTFLSSGYAGLVDKIVVRSQGSSMTALGAGWTIDDLQFGAPGVVMEHVGAANPQSEGFQVSGAPAGTAVLNDLGIGLDVWRVQSDSGGGDHYFAPLPDAVKQDAFARGWHLTVKVRVESGDTHVDLGFPNFGNRFDMHLTRDSNGDTVVTLPTDVVAATGPSYTLVGSGSTYHTYDLVFDPSTNLADLFVDGIRRLTGYAGTSQFNSDFGLLFGSGFTNGQAGVGYFSLARLRIGQ